MSTCFRCKTDVRGSRIECIDDRWLHDDCYAALRAALREAEFDIAILKRAHDDVQDRRKATETLLIAFGKAHMALDESDDGLGCDDIINEHVSTYEAIRNEAVRLWKEACGD